MKDWSDDADPHVASCKNKPSGADTYFGTRDQEVHRRRRNNALASFLQGLSAEERRQVAKALAANLKDLGLVIPSTLT